MAVDPVAVPEIHSFQRERPHFGYGSNMWPPWLWRDAPSARARGPALLEGHTRYFRKLSDDGSTKADIGSKRRSAVWGVLFDIDERDVCELNRKEGGYDPVPLSVRLRDGSEIPAWSYVARARRGRSRLRPYRWYIDLVCAGAAQFGVPTEYIRGTRRRPWKNDPDADRALSVAEFLAADPASPLTRALLVVGGACDTETCDDLIAHLESDRNAAWAARALRHREVIAWHATVHNRVCLAALSTGFEVLGGVRAVDATGRRRFLLSEARAQWEHVADRDRIEYGKLERYIQDEGTPSGIRNRTVTLLDDANGLRIVDGNKRAIALYTAAQPDVVLPVFVLYPLGVNPREQSPAGRTAM